MQHSSILLIRLRFSRRPDPLGCTQLNLNGAVFSLNQLFRTNLAVETPADWTSGRCCVDPLRPPRLSGLGAEKLGVLYWGLHWQQIRVRNTFPHNVRENTRYAELFAWAHTGICSVLPALGCGEINTAAAGGTKVGYAAAMCDRRMP
jgi:hypothetical protein